MIKNLFMPRRRRPAANGLARAAAALHPRAMISDPRAALFADVDTWVFDLDNTLYPARYNLFELVDRKIGAFVAALLGVDRGAARRVQKSYFREHGTTLRGLMLNHGVDPQAFLEFVHDIDVARVPPSPDLDAALARLDGRKLVFTNASARHAERVMERLGVAHHFEGVFDIADAGYVPKPHPETYAAMVARFAFDPRAAAMIEDIARNLEPAAAIGMTTVWLRNNSEWGREGSDGAYIDLVIDDLAGWLAGLGDGAPAA